MEYKKPNPARLFLYFYYTTKFLFSVLYNDVCLFCSCLALLALVEHVIHSCVLSYTYVPYISLSIALAYYLSFDSLPWRTIFVLYGVFLGLYTSRKGCVLQIAEHAFFLLLLLLQMHTLVIKQLNEKINWFLLRMDMKE